MKSKNRKIDRSSGVGHYTGKRGIYRSTSACASFYYSSCEEKHKGRG